MDRYVALLRGINVSGQKIIKMEMLKQIFEQMKFKNVRTYIQSGNVLLDSPEADSGKLTKKIESGLEKSLGYDVPVMIRSISEIEKIIKQNPFQKVKLDDSLRLYISFLSEEPDDELKKQLLNSADAIATYKIMGREVYTLYKRTKAKHPFSNNFVEKKLKVKATTRQWNVLKELFDLGSNDK
jgi:uncharacterized protein (DUF1697 family)